MAGTPKDFGTIAAKFEERPIPQGALLINSAFYMLIRACFIL